MDYNTIYRSLLSGFFLSMLIFSGLQADALTDILQEDETYYQNFGEGNYERKTKNKETTSYYDLFGDQIIDGFYIYNLSHTHSEINNADGVSDSTKLNQNYLMESNQFYEKFKNLAITRDAIGDSKFAFIIGSDIETRFTPLTMNKLYFHGIRWDLLTSGLKVTTLISRTRPSFLSKNGQSGNSVATFPEGNTLDYSNQGLGEDNITVVEGIETPSNVSLFGDYDMLYAVHAENNLGNILDYGITYINHHHSDIEKGELWYGSLPREYFPEEIHFEVYDLTAQNTRDPGAVVTGFQMIVNNGRPISAYDVYYPTGRDTILNRISRFEDSYEAQGRNPYLFVFRPDFQSKTKPEDIRSIAFRFTASGNYMVLVSSDKFSRPTISARTVKSFEGVDSVASNINFKTVEQAYLDGRQQTYNCPTASCPDLPVFYGEVVARAPKLLHIDAIKSSSDIFHYSNVKTYTYNYKLNTSSETFGVNIRARLGGYRLNGEFQINTKRYILPSASAQVEKRRTMAGYLELLGDVSKKINVAARAYYLAPEWRTELQQYDVSPFFSREDYYVSTIQPLSNQWYAMDDNDDEDQFVESEPRRYPEIGDGAGDYLFSGVVKLTKSKFVNLPNGYKKIYDDDDGIFSDRVDKNKNNVPDHQEDFLLFDRDPPIFELGNDLNNNGVPDQEDDDMYPDMLFTTQGEYPEYNPMPVHVYTSNGLRSLGVKGANLRSRYIFYKTPNSQFTTEVGGLYEKAVAADLAFNAKNTLDFMEYEAPVGSQHSYMGGYNSTRFKKVLRSHGIEINLENELRYVEDNIRNDAVDNVNGLGYITQTDVLDFRKSLLDNIIFRSYYTPGQFLTAVSMRLGVRKNMAIDGETGYWQTRTIVYDDETQGKKVVVYKDEFTEYLSRYVLDVNWAGRLRYDILFTNTYDDGWRAKLLNPLKRLKISPQFKLSYDFKYDTKTNTDPRSGAFDPFKLEDQLKFTEFYERNQNVITTTPILRANYQLGEKTSFEFGRQWKNVSNIFFPEESHTKVTTLVQVRSSDTYKGNNIALIFGMNLTSYDYNLEGQLGYDRNLGLGSLYDQNTFEIFARIYSGI